MLLFKNSVKLTKQSKKIVTGQNFRRVFSNFLHNKQQSYALGGGGGAALTEGATDSLAWIDVRKEKLFVQQPETAYAVVVVVVVVIKRSK
jgi:hypothetical protein